MTIQLSQVYKNNTYKDDMYVTISSDSELENLLYLKFYSNVNTITVELLQAPKKEVVRKLLLMEHVNKIIYKNQDGVKEEINSNRKLVVKMPDKGESDLISDDAIIRFQQIQDISEGVAIVQNDIVLSDEVLDMLHNNEIEFVRVLDYGKNKYTIQQIKDTRSKINAYIDIANTKNGETEKFIELYTYLCENISIDYVGASEGNVCDLLDNRTTAGAVAYILQRILSEMNIKSKVITGKLINGDPHCWNQVRLDFVWYNADLGLDIMRRIDDGDMKNCLKCDADFYEEHIAMSSNVEICGHNSSYFVAKDIEEKEGFIVRLFKKISKLVTRKKTKRISAGKRAC